FAEDTESTGRRFETTEQLAAGHDLECPRGDGAVRRELRSGGLPTLDAMASSHRPERSLGFVLHASTQTTAGQHCGDTSTPTYEPCSLRRVNHRFASNRLNVAAKIPALCKRQTIFSESMFLRGSLPPLAAPESAPSWSAPERSCCSAGGR